MDKNANTGPTLKLVEAAPDFTPTPANSNSPAAPKPAVKPVPNRADQEFLPAALEILETPPSPVMMYLILLLASFVAVALVWAWIGRIDIIATAQGKIQPPGRVKIVQPLEAGKVTEIKVSNGDRVAKGDVLIAFEPDDAISDVNNLEAATASFAAEALRRDAAIAAAQSDELPTVMPSVPWPDNVPATMRQREEVVLAADLSQLHSQILSIESQADVKRAEMQRLTTTITAQSTLVATLQRRVDMRAKLATSGNGSKTDLIADEETLQRETATLVGEQGQVTEAESAIKSLAADKAKQIQSFLDDNAQKRADANKQFEDYNERLAKARNHLRHMTLVSPADGIVQASSVFTIGQVVTAGQELMHIVPTDAKLEVEAYMANKDIGFVEDGQEVKVKVESYPFTRFGMLKGHVIHVAHDAIPLPEATQLEGNPAQASNTSLFAGAERTQNLVFPITIALDKSALMVEGKTIQMTPGMTVSAEIKTGNRRILDYVFSPLAETASEAMKER